MEVNFNRSNIFLLYFYDAYNTQNFKEGGILSKTGPRRKLCGITNKILLKKLEKEMRRFVNQNNLLS